MDCRILSGQRLKIFGALVGVETYKHDVTRDQIIVNALLRWFATNARDLPWRRTLDPYAIWVSEIMLQQTQVKTVIPYWERWMKRFPRVEILAATPMNDVLKSWEGLGYYSRARQLHRAAQIITDEHAGVFPANFNTVLALPGIGRYTAGAVCSIAFNQPTPILDGNVIRVLARVHGIATNPRENETNDHLWQLAGELVSVAASIRKPGRKVCSELNQALMELGALVCTPRNPTCEKCPLLRNCRARLDGRQHELPNLGPRPSVTPRRFAAFVIECDGRFLVRQRLDGVHNAQLWEFPNIEMENAEAGRKAEATNIRSSKLDVPPQLSKECLGRSVRNLKCFCTIKHSITRYRITIEAFRGNFPRRYSMLGNAKWLRLVEMEKLPFPSAHRRILVRLQNGERGV